MSAQARATLLTERCCLCPQADADALPDEELTREPLKQRNSTLATRTSAEADLPGLRKVHCDGERISSISPAALACMAGVESLYLQRNRLQGLGELAGLTRLRFLTLAHNRLTVVSNMGFGRDRGLQQAEGAGVDEQLTGLRFSDCENLWDAPTQLGRRWGRPACTSSR